MNTPDIGQMRSTIDIGQTIRVTCNHQEVVGCIVGLEPSGRGVERSLT